LSSCTRRSRRLPLTLDFKVWRWMDVGGCIFPLALKQLTSTISYCCKLFFLGNIAANC
jgi:hypothetical protein